jgi:5-formyltetrahydrofolate cyclo-ligase
MIPGMVLVDETEVRDFKSRLRQEAFARRDALPAAERARAANIIAARPFPVPINPGMVVSGFSAIRSELSPLPLMRRLFEAGATLALPIVAGRGQPLTMREWRFGSPLVSGVWGIREPPSTAREVFPDVLLVPFAAFDRARHRVGYGAGYYDMTITRLRAMKKVVAVGLGFAVQEIPKVPITPRDAQLDLVLTEVEIIGSGEG